MTTSSRPDGPVYWSVANPPDRRTSFSGSGLPFPSAAHAFQPGRTGSARATGRGVVDVPGPRPNAFLAEGGGRTVAPGAFLSYTSAGRQITEWRLAGGEESVPHRALTHAPDRTSPAYYDHRGSPVRSQNAILRAGAYDRESPGGWGDRPRR